MNLNRIQMHGFSKFSGKTLLFQPGLNIVYGPNESGKSSTFAFIKAMLYGFVKPGKLHKQYYAAYDRYLPWFGGAYGGELNFTFAKKDYLLTRNFLKGQEEVKLFDALTGADITDELSFDRVAKLPSVDSLFGVNRSVFEDVFAISAGDTANTDLAGYLAALFASFASGAQTSSDVKTALKLIKKKRDLIGTEKQSTKPYALARAHLQTLLQEKQVASAVHEENKARLRTITALTRENEGRKKGLASLRAALAQSTLFEKQQAYASYTSLSEEASLLQSQIAQEGQNGFISAADYAEYVRLNLQKQNDEQALRQIEEKKKKTTELIGLHTQKMQQLQNEGLFVEDSESLGYDELLLLKLKSKMRPAPPAHEGVEEAQEDVQRVRKKRSIFWALCALFALGALGSVACIFFLPPMRFYIAAGTGALLSVFFCVMALKMTKRLDSARSYYTKCYAEYELQESLYAEYQNELNGLLARYGCSAIEELDGKMLARKQAFADVVYLKDALAQAQDTLKELNAQAEEYSRNLAQATLTQNALREQGGVPADVDIDLVFASSGGVDVKKERLASVQTQLDAVLSRFSVEEMTFASTLPKVDARDAQDVGTLNEEIAALNEKILLTSSQMDTLASLCDQAQSAHRDLFVICEEIAQTEKEIASFETRLEALALAEKTIETLAEGIHRDIAPKLGSMVSGWVSFLTTARYGDVKVDENLHMRALETLRGNFVDVRALSNGTIDQFYFALKLSIADLCSKKANLPLFLDDCFLQYDDERLKNAMHMLSKIAQNRQVILFAATKRETTCAHKQRLKVNLIPIEADV